VFIISRAEMNTVTINTPWGQERAIYFHGKTFLPTHRFNSMAEAIATCRKDLDTGLFSIVVEEAEQIGVWCPIPEQIHTPHRTSKPLA
jgi:hypothetical protein